MKTQPSQSPDFDGNDYALYNSYQCAIQCKSTYNTNREDMIRWVEKNFRDFISREAAENMGRRPRQFETGAQK